MKSLWVSSILAGWGDVPDSRFQHNCLEHQLHFMQCRRGEWVQLGSTAARQCSSCQSPGYGSHQHTPLLSSTQPHTPHPPMWLGAHSVSILLVTIDGTSVLSTLCGMANRSDLAIMVVASISCHHDHQHLWLLIMNFSMYVSGVGLTLSTRLEHCPSLLREHDLKLTL